MIHILTEADSDADLVGRCLSDDEWGDVRVIAAGGRSPLTSLARSILVADRVPTLVLLDADTHDQGLIDRQRAALEEVIGVVARNIPFEVLLAVPELEIVFFEVPGLIERHFAGVDHDLARQFAEFSCKKALGMLAPGVDHQIVRERLLRALDADEIAAIRRVEPLRSLVEFIAAHRPAEIVA